MRTVMLATVAMALAGGAWAFAGEGCCGSEDEGGMACQRTTVAAATTQPSTRPVGETYVCPMHPEVVSDKPGKCPKCGMNLVEQKAEKADSGEKPHVHSHGDTK